MRGRKGLSGGVEKRKTDESTRCSRKRCQIVFGLSYSSKEDGDEGDGKAGAP